MAVLPDKCHTYPIASKMIGRSEQRHNDFIRIEDAYQLFYHELRLDGTLPYRSTFSGMWAVSDTKELYKAFCHFRLDHCSHLADLGSGDGVATLIASLFTQATGYETDEFLYRKSLEIRDELKLSHARFLQQDYFSADLSMYDMLYIYPDKPFDALIEKLRPTWRGHILVNGPHFTPKYLNEVAKSPDSVGKFVLYEPE